MGKMATLAFMYNSTPSSSTSYSPFFLLYGFKPHSPVNYIHGNLRSVVWPLTNQSAQEFIQELEVHHTLARDSLAHTLSRQAWAYDQKGCPKEYKVGDCYTQLPQIWARPIRAGRHQVSH